MAYVRLDDSVMDNPKMLALSDRAFRGWIWGLCYAQRHLTDGFLPLGALTATVKRGTHELMARGLWAVADGGFQIHDYLKHQDSKEVVEGRKGRARDRMRDRRVDPDRRSPARAPDVRANISGTSREASLPSSSVVSVSSYLEKGSGEKPPSARSGRLVFKGTKFVVFEWQLTNCVNDLGGLEAAEAFHLDEWFHDLNAQCELDRIIVPKRDGGAWLQQQLISEAQRRGIPLRIAVAAEAGKLTNRLGSALANIHAEAK